MLYSRNIGGVHLILRRTGGVGKMLPVHLRLICASNNCRIRVMVIVTVGRRIEVAWTH